MTNSNKQILKFNAGRDPERLAMKYTNMRSSAFVFMRASCHLFYTRLAAARGLPKSPPVWICGDLHLENFGSYKGDNRLVYFDISDFDEGVLAPANWELVRVLASILVGHDTLGLSRNDAEPLCQRFLDVYAQELSTGHARWVERDTALRPVNTLLDEVRTRKRADFLAGRTHIQRGRRLLRVDNGKALPVSAAQREEISAFFKEFAAQHANPEFYEVLDVARRVAGNGSLGVDRYVVLVKGKGGKDGNYLLDLKRSMASSLAKVVPIKQPAWKDHAHRVVRIQSQMQAIPMAFLHPVRLHAQPYVLRELQPSEDRVVLANSKKLKAQQHHLMTVMAQCTAWAQLRSSGCWGSANADALMAFGARNKWQKNLLRVAQHSADQVQDDWAAFSKAYDQGLFKLGKKH